LSEQSHLPERRQRFVAAILSGGVGLLLVLIVWARQSDLRVPPIIGYLAAGSFLAASATLMLQLRGATRAALVTTLLLVSAFSMIGGWVGFGPGSRQCEATIGSWVFLPGDLACRGVFGGGALLTAVMAVMVFRELRGSSRRKP